MGLRKRSDANRGERAIIEKLVELKEQLVARVHYKESKQQQGEIFKRYRELKIGKRVGSVVEIFYHRSFSVLLTPREDTLTRHRRFRLFHRFCGEYLLFFVIIFEERDTN